jgi:hypothetical protein
VRQHQRRDGRTAAEQHEQDSPTRRPAFRSRITIVGESDVPNTSVSGANVALSAQAWL